MPVSRANPDTRRARLSLALPVACSGFPVIAQAAAPGNPTEATTPDGIVVTAAGVEQTLTDAPASISIITCAALETRPYMTMTAAVRDLEAVDVDETSDKTGRKTTSIRGMGAGPDRRTPPGQPRRHRSQRLRRQPCRTRTAATRRSTSTTATTRTRRGPPG